MCKPLQIVAVRLWGPLDDIEAKFDGLTIYLHSNYTYSQGVVCAQNVAYGTQSTLAALTVICSATTTGVRYISLVSLQAPLSEALNM